MQFIKSIWNLNKPKWNKGFYPLTPNNLGSSMQIIFSTWNDPELKSSKYICLEGQMITYTSSCIFSLGTKHYQVLNIEPNYECIICFYFQIIKKLVSCSKIPSPSKTYLEFFFFWTSSALLKNSITLKKKKGF